MSARYTAERAISPRDASVSWVVISSEYELHVEACAYLVSLRRADRSINTERTYAPRVALYLSYCTDHGLHWKEPGLPGLARFLHWLIDEPLPS
ncbi:MAG TPA: integrase, partial [Streptomyces sp.]|nr:integrase [Streptomyces sp.]